MMEYEQGGLTMMKDVFERRIRKMMIVVFVIAVSLLCVSVSLRIHLNNIVEDNKVHQIEDEIDKDMSILQQQIDNDFQILDSFASVLEMENIVDNPQFPQVLSDANEQNDFTTMMYFDESKEGVIANSDNEVKEHQSLSMIQQEIQEIVADGFVGKRTISDIFKSRISQKHVYAYGIPIYQKGHVVGVLLATKNVEIWMDAGAGTGVLGGDTYAYLVDEDGQILVNSQYDLFHQTTLFASPFFQQKDYHELEDALQMQHDFTHSFQYDGQSYHGVLKPLGINNWYIYSVNMIDDSHLFTNENMRIVGLIFLFMVGLFVALLILGYRFMSKNNRELKHFAYYDSLTGVYNYSYFVSLGKEIFKEQPYCSVAVLNIRQFKFFNEIFGHEQGDQLLIYERNVIQKHLKEGEFFCRDRADQFYIYLKDTQKDILQKRIENIMSEIIQYVDLLHTNYQLKIHCGVAISSLEFIVDDSFDSLMVRVMFALAKAKEIILTSIWFYDIELHEQEKMDNYVESHMDQALKDGEFQLYLQPKIDLKDGTLKSSEALVRWQTHDGRMLFPNQFIPIFENSGFCKKLDLFMFEQACLQLRKWMDQGIAPIGISVNQSKLLFYEADYVDCLKQIVNKYQVSPQLLTLEILEDLVADNVDEVNDKIHLLHQIGFRVSMDDFGSGYSSLNILGKLHIDELKVDRGFLQEIFDSDNQKAKIILEEVIKLAKTLAISTVVEGIETKEYHDLMKSFGCDLGQGYYYSRPISQEDFDKRYMEERKEK